MNRAAVIGVLFLAALLEAVGDALIRLGLRGAVPWARALLILAGGVILVMYGCTVNLPPWDFGRLIGLYVVFFVLIAQVISWLVFAQPPSLPVLIGGGLIVCGGLVIALA